MTEANRIAFFTLVFALVFYVIGASFIQSFVNYPTWKFIGAYEFRSYHNAMSPLIITTMVLPWFLEIVLTFVLIWQRPRAIPRGAIVLAQSFNLIALASTIFIQIPIQAQFGASGMSSDALEMLIETDPIRWLPAILKGLLYLWMMLRIVTPANAGKRPVLLRIDYDAGHGIGSSRKQQNEESADVLAFLTERLR